MSKTAYLNMTDKIFSGDRPLFGDPRPYWPPKVDELAPRLPVREKYGKEGRTFAYSQTSEIIIRSNICSRRFVDCAHGSVLLWWRCNTLCTVLPVLWMTSC